MSALASKFNISHFQFGDKRKDLVKMARVAENAERYEDMCRFMRVLVKEGSDGKELTVEERNLLSVAYKNVIGARRASWRILNVDEHKDSEYVTIYRKQVEQELEEVCKDVLELLETNLISCAQGKEAEAEVFYIKLAGDYYRYLAEFLPEKGYDAKAESNYEKALGVATAKLAPTHPIRLGLALNYSVCFYEILKKKKEACDLAKKAFDDAISKLDQLDEASYKDSTLIMQLLRDNLTLWTSEDPEAAEEPEDDN